MATITETFYRDGNRVPITNAGIITKKTITFLGGTTDAWGNDTGALDGGALFTVTGLVLAQVVGVCKTDLAGGGKIEAGVTGATAIYVKQQTDTGIDKGFILCNETAAATEVAGAETAAAGNVPLYLLSGTNIILTQSTTNTTSGVIDFYCIWTPISSDGCVADSGL